MKDVKKTYTNFHRKNSSKHLYPTEWVIRTMLGNYPDLKLDRTSYDGSKILDLGFGDCRNMSLLANCGFDIYGVEITPETVALGLEVIKRSNIQATLVVGSNNNIPFPDEHFNYILASSSCYYVDAGSTFKSNLDEITRVLKPGGFFIGNFPAFSPYADIPDNFILKNSQPTEDGHVIIQGDIYKLRNGYKFKAFKDDAELRKTFNTSYRDICIGGCFDNYFGTQINMQILVAKKK